MEQLDTRGLACPLPVLKARKRLQALPLGDRLEVLATDPKSPADFRLWCNEAGHLLVEDEATGDAFRFVIQKGR